MSNTTNNDLRARIEALRKQALKHTELTLSYMAERGISPEGRIQIFLPPECREEEIKRLPYKHTQRQVVVYETEHGEFSALCPFSGLPDYGKLRIEYVPGDWLLELKSLKYYMLSWRDIGATQEDITAIVYDDLRRRLENPEYLLVSTAYNVRGGIRTTCTVDSRTSKT